MKHDHEYEALKAMAHERQLNEAIQAEQDAKDYEREILLRRKEALQTELAEIEARLTELEHT